MFQLQYAIKNPAMVFATALNVAHLLFQIFNELRVYANIVTARGIVTVPTIRHIIKIFARIPRPGSADTAGIKVTIHFPGSASMLYIRIHAPDIFAAISCVGG
ncbi:hypothetical protein WAI453_008887 [Rhynchosporium graminicola]